MKLLNLKLVAENALIIKAGAVTVVETSPKKNYKTSGRDIVAYDLHCRARKGDIQKVTVPISLAKEITALRELLRKSPVTVNLINPELAAFAMISENGKLISGVTAKADSFKVVGTVEDNCDDIDITEEN